MPADLKSSPWSRFSITLLLCGPALLLLTFLFIVAIDPYMVLPWYYQSKPQIAEDTQRYFLPMLLRTRSFDSFIFGSSTGGLIDPDAMNAELGGHFINLAIGDGRAWEQMELLRFVQRQFPRPKQLVFRFDWVWCIPVMNREQREIDRFPMWIYQPPTWLNVVRLLNENALKHSIKIVRMLALKIPPIIRDDGYLVFTPPESSFDLRKARVTLYGSPEPPPKTASAPPAATVTEEMRNEWRFPALDQLETALAGFPPATRVIFAGMPVHVTAQPVPGSIEEARELACKQRASRIADSHSGLFIDFRLHSAITENDENYWDPLHYRLAIARNLVSAIGTAVKSGASDPNAFWRIVSKSN
jgi:hypothetical protein